MTTDHQAHSTIQTQAAAPEDYDAIFAAVSETPRGRWFLSEFAKRNRAADTTRVLEEISRLERLMALQHPQVAANRRQDALHELATVLALAPDGHGDIGTEGLTPDVVKTLAFAIGQSGETIRDAVLTARGAALSMGEQRHDPKRFARFQDAVERHLHRIDEQADTVLGAATRIEALAQVIEQLRARLRIVLQSSVAQPAMPEKSQISEDRTAPAASAVAETDLPVSAEDIAASAADDADAEGPPAFEQVWHVPPVPAHARLRHVAALMQDDDARATADAQLIDDNPLVALAQSARTAHAGRTLAELDRLGYTERAALFA